MGLRLLVYPSAYIDLCRAILPLCLAGFLSSPLYAQLFPSKSSVRTVSIGVVGELILGNAYYWGQLMAGPLRGSIPVALIYSFVVKTTSPASPRVLSRGKRREGNRPRRGGLDYRWFQKKPWQEEIKRMFARRLKYGFDVLANRDYRDLTKPYLPRNLKRRNAGWNSSWGDASKLVGWPVVDATIVACVVGTGNTMLRCVSVVVEAQIIRLGG